MKGSRILISRDKYQQIHGPDVPPVSTTPLYTEQTPRTTLVGVGSVRQHKSVKNAVDDVLDNMPLPPITGTDLTGKKVKLSKEALIDIRREQFRDVFLERYFGLTQNTDLKTTKQWYCFHSVRSTTFRSYATAYHALLRAGEDFDFRRPEVDPREVMNDYITAYGETSIPAKSLASYTVAINFYCRATGRDGALDQQKLLRDGVLSQLPLKSKLRRPRGAITHHMVRDLISLDHIRGTPFADGYVIQHAFGLRNEQVLKAKVADFRVARYASTGELFCYSYESLRHKQYNSNSYTVNELENHAASAAWNKELGEILARIEKRWEETGEEYAVPGWDCVAANFLVKDAAVRLGWDPLVNWVDHGIRHGAAVDAAEASADQTVEGRLLAAQAALCHKTPTITIQYMKPQQQRLAEGRAYANAQNAVERYGLVNDTYEVVIDRANGSMRIQRMQNFKSTKTARVANLINKKRLRSLTKAKAAATKRTKAKVKVRKLGSKRKT
jgi:hypothetical protein